MPVPVVAIVGRPNVGKSSLFNWLSGRRISIVDPTAGVTRDRVSTILKIGERFCELVDTGGMGIEDADDLTADVERQIETALTEATVILFVVDVRAGLMPLDEEVARRLRGVAKPILLVANKCDTEALEAQAAEFFKFGKGKVFCVSAEQHRGREALISALHKRLPEGELGEEPEAAELKLAIVGRRNVGKSTFINALAKGDRMIVSEVAGTTRDSVDVRFQRDGKTFLAIDTAGVRRKTSIANNVEFYSMHRAERSIRRADVVLLFLDPRLRISKVDKQLAAYIQEHHKPAIFVVNKWDLARASMPTERFANYVRTIFPMLDYLPIAFITAKVGKNVQRLLDLSRELHKQACARVGTGELNRVIREAFDEVPPPTRMNRRPKIYYGTQVGIAPPTVVLFTNGPDLIEEPYQRYLLKTFRDRLPYGEVPIKLFLRQRQQDEGGGSSKSAEKSDFEIDTELETGVEAAASASAAPPPAPTPPPARPRRRTGEIRHFPINESADSDPAVWDV